LQENDSANGASFLMCAMNCNSLAKVQGFLEKPLITLLFYDRL